MKKKSVVQVYEAGNRGQSEPCGQCRYMKQAIIDRVHPVANAGI
jgi:hypothetical protein